MKNENPWRLEIKDKWYANLSCMAINTLHNAGILEDPEKVKELCRNGKIRKLRNIGKIMFTQICIALGVTIHSKVSNMYCPNCNKPFGLQLHRLKETIKD